MRVSQEPQARCPCQGLALLAEKRGLPNFQRNIEENQCFQLLNRVPWGRISSFMVRLALQAVLTDFFVKIMMFLMVLSMFFVIINVDRTRMFLEAILATYESAERRVTLQTVDPLIPFAQPKRRSLIANPKI